jgi:hypothetical protein
MFLLSADSVNGIEWHNIHYKFPCILSTARAGLRASQVLGTFHLMALFEIGKVLLQLQCRLDYQG